MDSSALPLVLIEVLLVFGGVLAFGVWQLRSVARDREATARERARREREAQAEPPPAPAPPPGGSGGAA